MTLSEMTETAPTPPHTLDSSVVSRLDPEYLDFFQKNVAYQTKLLYTYLYPVDVLRKAGNVMPGQSPLANLKSYDEQVPRKYTKEHGDSPVSVRIFVPNGKAPEGGWPCTVWFHGGGWVLGNITTENSYCSHMADLAKCVVVSVDYRLAPEFPFPACVHDGYEAVIWAVENAQKLGINNSKIAIGGSSAGGNITAILCHIFANDSKVKIPPIVYQLLIVPVCDNTADVDSHLSWKEFEHTPQLPRLKMLWYRNHYLPNKQDWTNPVASPIFYPDESFKNVPPAFVAVAECDVLRTEGELYAKKIRDAGVESTLVIYPGVPHPVMAMDEVLTQGKVLLQDTTSAVRKAFYGE
jgi:acetyl esterase/lipase